MSNFTRGLRYSAIQFTRSSKSTGILLLLCTCISLLLTNSVFGEHYLHFWETDSIWMERFTLPKNLSEWVNDGLMAIFFLTAGMEIKRELLEGELKSLKKAILPLFAAVGGVAVPAIVYTVFNNATPYAHGWGIPTATDIAFSIGIMSILGRKYVPDSLKVFLTALAIIDDLIAIVIVAFFYGGALNWIWLGIAGLIILVLYFLLKKNTTIHLLHILLGLVLWYTMLRSGIHATMAGVIFGFLVPLQCMEKVEHKLHKPVNFFIIPIFALANTYIPFNVSWYEIFKHPLFWGISVGLFLGKVLGITLFSYLLIKMKWAFLPSQTSAIQFVGAGILAGIGFTMSIFIATLAFDNPEWQNISKIAILFGSLLSMLVGYCWLKMAPSKAKKKLVGLP